MNKNPHYKFSCSATYSDLSKMVGGSVVQGEFSCNDEDFLALSTSIFKDSLEDLQDDNKDFDEQIITFELYPQKP